MSETVGGLLGGERWSTGLMTRAETERLFSLTLPPGAVIHHRSLGFQDPYLTVLLQLPDRAAFEQANALGEGASTEDTAAADAEVRRLGTPKGAVTVHGLTGIDDLLGGDGGYVEWHRAGAVLVYEDQTWLYLVAFGT